MKLSKRILYLACFLLSYAISLYNERNINSINILLPAIYEEYNFRSIEYELIANNGCYNWESSYPEILQVIQLESSNGANSNCFQKAKLILKTYKLFSEIIWITAKDKSIYTL